MPAPKKSPNPTRNPRRPSPNPRRNTDMGTDSAVGRGNRAAEREARDAESLMPQRRSYGGKVMKKAKGGFPDLNNDGKVTRADILKGRGVKGMKQGGTCRGMGAATRGGKYSRG